ncbi:ATP-binding protein [Nocardia yunnanensis]|uniref:ATP-binding protein n=1 Tax=Nocardia yunnanensis TaxID=2382165 RepID=A0A386ZJZ7_9NOCA|nr:ATP-binding protein [Nocardia yunnanensis]
MCINRIAELEQARRAFEGATLRGAPLLLAVTGAAGIGKSVMVRTLAYELGPRFTRTIYYGAVGSDAPVLHGAEDIAADLLVQLGVPWRELPDPVLRCSVLRALIEQHRPLVVLDGIDSASQVLPLLGDVRDAAVLVSGRKPLRELRAAGFITLSLRGFDDAAGIELIRAMAGGEIAGVEPELLRRLVSVFGGVPELLVAAGIQLADDAESAADFVRDLEHAGELDAFVAELSLDERPVVVAVCDASYGSLTVEEARAYRLLSAIPVTGFDLELAAVALDRSTAVTRRLLRRSADKALLRWNDGDLIEFPHAMRHHARALHRRLDSNAVRDDVERRIANWCVRRAVALAKSLSDRPIPAEVAASVFREVDARYTGPDAVERAAGEFSGRWGLFVAAQRAALEGGLYSEATILAIALWPFAYQTRRVHELVDGYRSLLEVRTGTGSGAAGLAESATRWQLMRDLAGLHECVGETTAAKDLLDRAAALGYEQGTASRLEWQALALEGMGQTAEALVVLAQAWDAVRLLDDPAHRERSYQLLRMHRARMRLSSGTFEDSGEIDSVTADLVIAEAYFRSRGEVDAVNSALCRGLRGDIAAKTESSEHAELLWSEALDVMLAYGKYAEAATLYERLLREAERRGRTADAQRHREALSRCRERFS